MNEPIDAQSRDDGSSYHGKNHGEEGRDKVLHRVFGKLHTDVDPAAYGALTEGDILDVNAAGKLTRVARSVPGGADLLNVWSFITGTTRGVYRALFDGTNPTTIAEGDAAAPGTGVKAARITHKHAAPATWLATPHDILSARHGDTLADAVVRGDVLYGNATPKWARLAKPSLPSLLYNDATDVSWKAFTSVKAGPQGSGSLTVNQNTATAVTFNAESWDTNAQHDTGSNTERLTCVLAGRYHISGTVYWNAEAVSTTTILQLSIYYNGAATELQVRTAPLSSIGTFGQHVQVSGDLTLALNDYVHLSAYYDANAATTRTLALTGSSFSMYWIGP